MIVEKPCKQHGAADQQAGFDHRRLHRDVAGSLLQTLFDGAHAVADFESDVPEQADQLFEARGQHAVGLLWQQDQQIDVGRRVQFAASVTADRNQRQRRRHQGSCQSSQHFVDQTATLGQQTRRIALGTVLLGDCPLTVLETGLTHCFLAAAANHQPVDSINLGAAGAQDRCAAVASGPTMGRCPARAGSAMRAGSRSPVRIGSAAALGEDRLS
jgi:hypothetical protein